MSFVVGVCVFISLLLGGVSFLVFRRRRWIGLVVMGTSFIALLAWFLNPVCVPMTLEDVALFDPPIETRTDTGMIGQAVFQQRDGDWFHCKVWIARELFI